jgi:hypothetical protein
LEKAFNIENAVYTERTPIIMPVVVGRYLSPKTQDRFPIKDVGNDE